MHSRSYKKVKTFFFSKVFSQNIFPSFTPFLHFKRQASLGSQGSEAYNLHISFLITFVYFKFLLLPTLLNSLRTTAIKERTTALKKKHSLTLKLDTAGLKPSLLFSGWVSKLCNFLKHQYSYLYNEKIKPPLPWTKLL